MPRLARVEMFASYEAAIVHVLNRTVHRCFLLGNDPVSRKNFDHRKQWMESELPGTVVLIPQTPTSKSCCNLLGNARQEFSCNGQSHSTVIVEPRPPSLNLVVSSLLACHGLDHSLNKQVWAISGTIVKRSTCEKLCLHFADRDRTCCQLIRPCLRFAERRISPQVLPKCLNHRCHVGRIV